MKQIRVFSLAAAAMLAWQVTIAGEITDTYNTGDVLTTTQMNNIKSAVNDNNSRLSTAETNVGTNRADIDTNTSNIGNNRTDIDTNTTNIGNNRTDIDTNITNIQINTDDISSLQDANDPFSKVLDSRTRYQIPVLSNLAGNTSVSVWLSNQSSTTCSVYTANSLNLWRVGTNAKGSLILVPTFVQTSLPGVVTTGTFPLITTTTTIVAISNMNSDVSAQSYVDLTLTRAETNTLDTCNVGDVIVRGAIVTYPNGSQYYVPVQDMIVE